MIIVKAVNNSLAGPQISLTVDSRTWCISKDAAQRLRGDLNQAIARVIDMEANSPPSLTGNKSDD